MMAESGAILTTMIFATILVLFAAVIFFAQRYKRCPPDKVMVVYGRTDKGKASRTIHGGAALVWPLIQDYAFLSLTPITINIDITGVRRLSILVDFGQQLDIADHLHLCNARITK